MTAAGRLAAEKAQMVSLLHLPGVTTRGLREALALFGSPAGAWEAFRSGDARSYAPSFADWTREAPRIDPASLMDSLEAAGIDVVVAGEAGYPTALSAIHDPPLALFYRGALPGGMTCVSIVGSRKATTYGLEAARWLAEGLACHGLCVVSGAAYGIDSAAHAGALDGSGHTIAVLGCGVDVVYPRRNAALFARIVERGCLLSEYIPATEPRAYQFPARNRIIAGLSAATIVVEASERSGALLTADFALAENRDVLAVPGQIFSANSAGTHGLIRSGAAAVCSVEDVLAEMGIDAEARSHDNESRSPAGGLGEGERRLLEALEGGPCDLEGLCANAGLSAAAASAALSSLEVRGLVKRSAGGVFQKCRPR